MTEELKLYSRYTITAFISYVIFYSTIIIDGIFCGKYVSSSSLASILIVSPIISLCDSFGLIFVIGSNSIIGSYLGEKREEEANSLFTKISILIFIVTFLISSIFSIYAREIIILIGGNEDTIKDSITYLRLYMCSYTFKIFEAFICMILRLIGRPTVIPFFSFGYTILNIVLKYIFVLILKRGIFGIISSTSISIFVELIAYLIYFFSIKDRKLKFTKKFDNLINNLKELTKIVYNGFSIFFIDGAVAVNYIFLNKEMLSKFGTNGSIAFSTANYIVTFNYIFLYCFSDSITPLISTNYGKKDFNKIKRFFIKYSIISSMTTGIILFLLSSIFPNFVINCFLKKEISKEVLNLSIRVLGILKYSCIFLPFLVTFEKVLIAMQKSNTANVISIFSTFIVPMFFLYTLKNRFEYGVFYSIEMANFSCLCMFLCVFFLTKKKYFNEV